MDFNEFVCGVVRYINSHQEILEGPKQKGLDSGLSDVEAGEENAEEEEEEMPVDLAHLSPKEQQQRLKMRAAYYLIIGTGLVIIFSDPMVNVLSEIGTRTVSITLPSFSSSLGNWSLLCVLCSSSSCLQCLGTHCRLQVFAQEDHQQHRDLYLHPPRGSLHE